ncbi:MAG: undecaprenyldiphospho-muramoylpentapeptide beta-N-acetylglucosaminyltransferase [Spirochaetaceae bacterium]|jgi:UDP-N-acetylglucosamine--N-acetylmuramyl-(pentapeptide) pyrophosphoryl-undecaprenol N-acetylglucosamine transferase|nr:undecaprenyldiphospho-muramoylpentapeptide beta-N-acetylglucosaminyltransferase [Spirochaetaceae bacterium]
MNSYIRLKSVIAFTGGGTGGHIYPGLAVAAALRDICGCDIVWLGSKNKIDRSIVEAAGIKFEEISSGKLRRYFSLRNFTDIFRIIAGFFASLLILKRRRPSLLFSKGGFVSVPPVVAAFMLRIPVYTHESDFSPGLATKINAHLADKIFIAYKQTASYLSRKFLNKVIQSGNPVRPEFYAANPEKGRSFLQIPPGEKILLVLGGSQGAAEINNLVENSLAGLTKNFFVVHQTGGGGELNTDKTIQPRYIRLSYIKDEMPDILAAAALVLGRAGAGTVWECAATGRPMVLVPLSGSATRGDQIENAKFFEERGAARMLVRPDAAQLLETLNDLAGNEGQLTAMAAASAQIGTTRGAPVIAEHIVERILEK